MIPRERLLKKKKDNSEVRILQKCDWKIAICNTNQTRVSLRNKQVESIYGKSSSDFQSTCKRILRYLKNTLKFSLEFNISDNCNLAAFSDADWRSDINEKKSISGYCVYLGNNLVSQSSKKQHIVARSNAEFEYKTLKLSILTIPIIWSDSVRAAAAMIANPIFHTRIKHI